MKKIKITVTLIICTAIAVIFITKHNDTSNKANLPFQKENIEKKINKTGLVYLNKVYSFEELAKLIKFELSFDELKTILGEPTYQELIDDNQQNERILIAIYLYDPNTEIDFAHFGRSLGFVFMDDKLDSWGIDDINHYVQLSSKRQLSEKIQLGMTINEVVGIIGSPTKVTFSADGETYYEYRAKDQSPHDVLHVCVSNGIVTSLSYYE